MRRIDDVNFWRQVKADFEKYPFATRICLCSPLFKRAWYYSKYRVEILKNAQTFDFEKASNVAVGDNGDCVVLFDVAHSNEAHAVRLAFLDYMIEKTSRNDD